jgi:hypothetical protein
MHIVRYGYVSSILVAVRYEEQVCSHLITEIAGSNSAKGIDVRLFLLCVV